MLDGVGKNFSVGDEIFVGVILEWILFDWVIINCDGVDEILMLGGCGVGLFVILDDLCIVVEIDVFESELVLEILFVIEGCLVGLEVLFGVMNVGLVMIGG